MQKKKSAILFFVVLIFILLLQGCSIQKTKSFDADSNYFNTSESIDPSEETNTSKEEKTIAKSEKDTAYISSINGGCKLAQIGESVTLRGLSYTVNSVTYTKQQGNWDDISGDVPKLNDSKMIIAKNQYYIVVNITVKDIDFDENKDGDFYWNTIWLDSLSREYNQIGAFEMDSASIVCQSKEQEESNYVYKQDFTKGQELTTDLIYSVDLEQSGTHPYFMLGVNPSGLKYSEEKPNEYFEVYLQPLTGVF